MADSSRFQPNASLDVVGIGNAIVDVLVQTKDGFLSEHGLQKGGMCLIDEQQAEALYKSSGPGLETCAEAFARCQPIFETLPGWQCSTAECRTLEDLPEKAMAYLRFLADLMEVPIAIVSLGAGRDQTIVVEDPIHGPKRALLSA